MSDTAPIQIVARGEAETRRLGERLGRALRLGDVVLLHGDLGAGKTTLAQGLARGLGVEGYVQSPTFGLVHEHEVRTAGGEPLTLYHLDLYRLAGEEDLDSFGFDDYLAPERGIALIEWPERAASRLPEAYLLVRLEPLGAGERRVTVEAVPTDSSLAERLVGVRRELVGNHTKVPCRR